MVLLIFIRLELQLHPTMTPCFCVLIQRVVFYPFKSCENFVSYLNRNFLSPEYLAHKLKNFHNYDQLNELCMGFDYLAMEKLISRLWW
jgi:hypothetical protein